jgi:hypothetical protein
VRKKIIFVPDGHETFGQLTVRENLKLIKSVVKNDKHDSGTKDSLKFSGNWKKGNFKPPIHGVGESDAQRGLFRLFNCDVNRIGYTRN